VGDIVPGVYNGDHLDADIDTIRDDASISRDADLLNAFLDEVAGSEEALWQLLRRNTEHDARPGLWFNCKAVECFLDAGYNVSRMRPLQGRLRKYRILYAYEKDRNELHLLAVVLKRPDPAPQISNPRHYDYEPNHPISKRIRNEYDQRKFAKIS
jgi:hypothetical protein